jgi:hypothetical protein
LAAALGHRPGDPERPHFLMGLATRPDYVEHHVRTTDPFAAFDLIAPVLASLGLTGDTIVRYRELPNGPFEPLALLAPQDASDSAVFCA